ncbi:ribonuclease H-like domain-containing protein [Fimicolochytrium jonesii]|uniref:ribonuclease H-like domain-containing protein n=1 Tax=Fimicolochytrium jonesii TaxID=1396493 RepID=UPI0022FE1FA3|nr:ribonuclease H-like domain-containing protein [Fimicolochytrium jonesii]KAI8819182.1 ribonuclease H-like domain-containing protein [Fimicolochytrium jonesii]
MASEQSGFAITPENFEDYQTHLFTALVGVTKASQFLQPNELGFYKASVEGFDESLTNAGDQLLEACNRLLKHSTSKAVPTSDRVRPFEDADDVTDRFAAVVDTVDHLLEKADMNLDKVTGRIKKNAPGNVPGQSAPVIMQVQTKQNTFRKVVHAQNISRPQLSFEDKVDNSNTPFVRKITQKPNAKRPLDYGLPGSADLTPEMSAHLRSLGITDASSSKTSHPHPYEYEIQNIEYPHHMFEVRPEQLYESMEETPYTYVDTDEKLDRLAALLDSVKEIAIDTEHHDYRTFQGFVCLMQISTRTEDFIIDTLAVRSRMHVLNSSFTNPEIVKVFHGADMDIVWMQRDFGLYIVNLFDTYHASHLLEMPHHGLAHLLKYYCNVETNKAYQLADWRIRPLPKELLKYARSDTHYLLYIYDRMRNELLTLSNPETHNLMRATLTRSAETALKKYEKDIYDSETGEGPNGWRQTLRKYGGALRPEQFALFRAIHAWRDHTAREEDESPRYVLPTHMMFTLADRMPTDQQGILGCCSPVPPLVRMYATDLALIIENGLIEATRSRERNEALLAKLKEDEREWMERKKRGPQHLRFGEKDEGEVTTGESTPAEGPPPILEIQTLPTSRLFGTVKDAAKTSTVTHVSITTSSIFGTTATLDADEDERAVQAKRLAEEIRRTLRLEAPVGLLQAKRKRDDSDDTESPLPSSKSPRASLENTTASKSLTPSESKISATPPAPIQSRVAPPTTTLPTDIITLSDEEIEVADIKRKGSKARKRPKKDALTTDSSSPTRAKKGKKDLEFTPYDYSKKGQSSTHQEPMDATEDFDGVFVLDSDEEPQQKQQSKKGKGPKQQQQKVFEPYKQGEGPKQKKDARVNMKPKSGNKSGTFRRND